RTWCCSGLQSGRSETPGTRALLHLSLNHSAHIYMIGVCTMKMTPISVAWVFAASFYAAAVIGLLPNPLLGAHGLFVTSTAHNFVHLLTGVGFTIVALTGSSVSVVFMQAFGVIYALTGLIGFLATGHDGDAHLLGLVHINALEN